MRHRQRSFDKMKVDLRIRLKNGLSRVLYKLAVESLIHHEFKSRFRLALRWG
ncbi:hypothetical protein Heal19_500979 [Lactiplantibacillus plantarum]|nr:hypothetical protein Heal19_500979 [Lactiplantibacillus plantarum]